MLLVITYSLLNTFEKRKKPNFVNNAKIIMMRILNIVLKHIVNKLNKYFFGENITWTIQTHMYSTKVVQSNISQ